MSARLRLAAPNENVPILRKLRRVTPSQNRVRGPRIVSMSGLGEGTVGGKTGRFGGQGKSFLAARSFSVQSANYSPGGPRATENTGRSDTAHALRRVGPDRPQPGGPPPRGGGARRRRRRPVRVRRRRVRRPQPGAPVGRRAAPRRAAAGAGRGAPPGRRA